MSKPDWISADNSECWEVYTHISGVEIVKHSTYSISADCGDMVWLDADGGDELDTDVFAPLLEAYNKVYPEYALDDADEYLGEVFDTDEEEKFGWKITAEYYTDIKVDVL